MVAVAGSGRSGGGVPKLKKMTVAELAGAGEDGGSRRRGRGNPSAHGWTVVGGGGEDGEAHRGGRRGRAETTGAGWEMTGRTVPEYVTHCALSPSYHQ